MHLTFRLRVLTFQSFNFWRGNKSSREGAITCTGKEEFVMLQVCYITSRPYAPLTRAEESWRGYFISRFALRTLEIANRCSVKLSKQSHPAVCRARKVQFSGPALRSFANFDDELEQFFMFSFSGVCLEWNSRFGNKSHVFGKSAFPHQKCSHSLQAKVKSSMSFKFCGSISILRRACDDLQ